MTQQQLEECIKRVAAKHHISSEEVLLDIENCIAETHKAITMSANSELLREWQPGGNRYTSGYRPVRYIFYAALPMPKPPCPYIPPPGAHRCQYGNNDHCP